MNLQKLGDCYSEALEISDLIEILITYLEYYQDEDQKIAKLTGFSKMIHAKNKELLANIDDIFSDESFKTNSRPQENEDG